MMNALYATANFGITIGYLFVAIAVLPHFVIHRGWVKWAGALFFITCGLTHADMGISALLGSDHAVSWYGMLIHTVQVGAVWAFVLGLYLEFVIVEGD